MNICKGKKSQGTHGTEGTRVHQGTDVHLQRRKLSRYTRYRRDEGTSSYRWTSAKERSLKAHMVQKGRGYTKVQMNICKRQTSQILLSRFYFRTFQVLMVFLLLFRGICIQISFRDITSCVHEGLVNPNQSKIQPPPPPQHSTIERAFVRVSWGSCVRSVNCNIKLPHSSFFRNSHCRILLWQNKINKRCDGNMINFWIPLWFN